MLITTGTKNVFFFAVRKSKKQVKGFEAVQRLVDGEINTGVSLDGTVMFDKHVILCVLAR